MIIPIQKSPFLIGRNDECQLRAANPNVSHRHCELLTEDGKIAVRDCNSTNGTFINSQRVEGQVEFHEGDASKSARWLFSFAKKISNPLRGHSPEPASPKQSRSVDEEAVGDILLKLDEEDTGQPGPGPGTWRSTSAEDPSSQPGPAKGQKADKSGPENEPTPRPSDVTGGY